MTSHDHIDRHRRRVRGSPGTPVKAKNAHAFISFYRNRKLDISTAPTKAKSGEPAYSQALVQNKIDRQRVRFR